MAAQSFFVTNAAADRFVGFVYREFMLTFQLEPIPLQRLHQHYITPSPALPAPEMATLFVGVAFTGL